MSVPPWRGRYLAGRDVAAHGPEGMQLTIAYAVPIGRGGRRIALTFRELEKRLVLNQANRHAVEALTGTRDLLAWRGTRVRLATVDTTEGRRISVQAPTPTENAPLGPRTHRHRTGNT